MRFLRLFLSFHYNLFSGITLQQYNAAKHGREEIHWICRPCEDRYWPDQPDAAPAPAPVSDQPDDPADAAPAPVVDQPDDPADAAPAPVLTNLMLTHSRYLLM